MSYVVDKVGNRILMTDTHGVTSYVYDALNRLENVQYPDGETVTYQYDPVGNRIAMTSTVTGAVNYTYNSANQLKNAGALTATWDANGNMLGLGDVSYDWDSLDRLIQVTDGSSVITYTYNGDDVRIVKSANGITTTYMQNQNRGLPVVLVENNSSGSIHYVYGDKLPHDVR